MRPGMSFTIGMFLSSFFSFACDFCFLDLRLEPQCIIRISYPLENFVISILFLGNRPCLFIQIVS